MYWTLFQGLTMTVQITPQEAIRGLREVVETFRCTLSKAYEIVREMKMSKEKMVELEKRSHVLYTAVLREYKAWLEKAPNGWLPIQVPEAQDKGALAKSLGRTFPRVKFSVVYEADASVLSFSLREPKAEEYVALDNSKILALENEVTQSSFYPCNDRIVSYASGFSAGAREVRDLERVIVSLKQDLERVQEMPSMVMSPYGPVLGFRRGR